MTEDLRLEFRQELERIPRFKDIEQLIECMANSAPKDKPYEFIVACLCPKMDKALTEDFQGPREAAVFISVLVAKLIEARRSQQGFAE